MEIRERDATLRWGMSGKLESLPLGVLLIINFNENVWSKAAKEDFIGWLENFKTRKELQQISERLIGKSKKWRNQRKLSVKLRNLKESQQLLIGWPNDWNLTGQQSSFYRKKLSIVSYRWCYPKQSESSKLIIENFEVRSSNVPQQETIFLFWFGIYMIEKILFSSIMSYN